MVCDAADASYYKMQVYPGKDAALQVGTKPTKPVNNGLNDGTNVDYAVVKKKFPRPFLVGKKSK